MLYISYYSCRYKSTSNAEQHFFPSSLAFNFMCLLDFGLIHAAHLGFQRKVLLELRSQGKDDLVEPNALYSVCLLVPFIYYISTLLHFVAFFHIASLFSTGLDNAKVGVDNEKAQELDNRIIFFIFQPDFNVEVSPKNATKHPVA